VKLRKNLEVEGQDGRVGCLHVLSWGADPERECVQREVGEVPCPNCGGEVRIEP
jgi:hypothetical protein